MNSGQNTSISLGRLILAVRAIIELLVVISLCTAKVIYQTQLSSIRILLVAIGAILSIQLHVATWILRLWTIPFELLISIGKGFVSGVVPAVTRAVRIGLLSDCPSYTAALEAIRTSRPPEKEPTLLQPEERNVPEQ